MPVHCTSRGAGAKLGISDYRKLVQMMDHDAVTQRISILVMIWVINIWHLPRFQKYELQKSSSLYIYTGMVRVLRHKGKSDL